MGKNLLMLAFFMFSGTFLCAQADDITGIWVPAKGTSQVRIYKGDNGKYFGRVEWKKEDRIGRELSSEEWLPCTPPVASSASLLLGNRLQPPPVGAASSRDPT